MPRTIQYGVTPECTVISKVGSEVAWPIVKWDDMGPHNNFEVKYQLEKMALTSVVEQVKSVFWVRKLPVELKNFHRRFWGFKPLKEEHGPQAPRT